MIDMTSEVYCLRLTRRDVFLRRDAVMDLLMWVSDSETGS